MFNELVLQHWQNPYHRGLPDEPVDSAPNGEQAFVLGQAGFPGEGPFMQILLHLNKDTIESAWFETYACPAAIACGSWLAHWLEGRSSEQVRLLEARDLELMLGGLPPGKEHCSALALEALRSAAHQIKTVL